MLPPGLLMRRTTALTWCPWRPVRFACADSQQPFHDDAVEVNDGDLVERLFVAGVVAFFERRVGVDGVAWEDQAAKDGEDQDGREVEQQGKSEQPAAEG